MIHIHEKEVIKIAKCNLLHEIINPPKRAKNFNIHHYPIVHGCTNTRHDSEKFKNFRIILDIGFSSTIVMGILFEKLHPEKDSVIQCHTQAIYITTNYKVKVYFTLPALSATNVVTWKCHYSAKGK